MTPTSSGLMVKNEDQRKIIKKIPITPYLTRFGDILGIFT
jgi:hypothetical protein